MVRHILSILSGCFLVWASASYRRHDDLVQFAQPRLILILATGRENSRLGKADPYLAKALSTSAAHRNHVGLKGEVRLEKIVFDFLGRYDDRFAGTEVTRRDLDRVVEFA